MINRLPPQNVEAEQSILAGCLLFPDLCEQAIEHLTGQEFYRTVHKNIFQAISKLFEKKEPVDLVTVQRALDGLGKLKESGGSAYLAKLTDCPIPSSMSHYCRMVRDAALLRKTIEVCNGAINSCYRSDDANQTISAVQEMIGKIDDGVSTDTFVTMKDLTMQSWERYEAAEKQEEIGIKTGFWRLDALTGGFKGSKLIIIAARPGMGKTSFMRNLVANMAKRGTMSGVFSIEMDNQDLDDQWNASESGINSMRLSNGSGLNEKEWKTLIEAFEHKSKWPVILDDTGGLHIRELKRRARKMKKLGCRIIFIDQLSKIKINGPSEYERNTEILNELGSLKKELRIPVVLLAQINRKVEERESKMPVLADLKSTGRIEEEADIVIFIHRPYEYTQNPEQERVALFRIAKQRGGPKGTIICDWEKKTTTFSCEEPNI